MNDKIKNIVKHVLLAFVFLSVGFSLGKDFSRRSFTEPGTVSQREKGEKVVVYYMHGTFRCSTCNEIERLTKETVEKDFADEVAKGLLIFQAVNFQKEEQFANRYKIAAGCVVVAKIADGRDSDFKALKNVWTLYDSPPEFKEYLGETIREYLGRK
jgi:hypothetical protein